MMLDYKVMTREQVLYNDYLDESRPALVDGLEAQSERGWTLVTAYPIQTTIEYVFSRPHKDMPK